MYRNTRRTFLAHVGKGMLIGGVGSALTVDLGLPPVFADGSIRLFREAAPSIIFSNGSKAASASSICAADSGRRNSYASCASTSEDCAYSYLAF